MNSDKGDCIKVLLSAAEKAWRGVREPDWSELEEDMLNGLGDDWEQVKSCIFRRSIDRFLLTHIPFCSIDFGIFSRPSSAQFLTGAIVIGILKAEQNPIMLTILSLSIKVMLNKERFAGKFLTPLQRRIAKGVYRLTQGAEPAVIVAKIIR
jgi:hypothetical protein